MPDRMLRTGLIWSEKINAVSGPPCAEILYVRLQLIADDFGLVDLSPGGLKMRALPGRQWDITQIADCIRELLDIGLLRGYTVEGKQYGAIEKWNQTRWSKASKLPMPPWGTEHIVGGYVAPRAKETAPEPAKQPAKPRSNGKHPPAPDEAFAAFWAAYPRKVAKAEAVKAWAKLAPSDDLHPVIIRAVLAQSAGPDWRKEGGRYIPHPASWLNARRWEDEVKPAAAGDRAADGYRYGVTGERLPEV